MSPLQRFFRFAAAGLGAACLTAPLPAQLSKDARKLYTELCASCHGANQEGGLGTSLVDGVWKRGNGDDAYIARVITEGQPELGMPAFGATLDASRVRALTVFLREREGREKEKGVSYAKPERGEVVKSELQSFRVETVVEGLDIPWSITFLPKGGGALITERKGDLRVVREGKLLPEPVRDTPKVFAQGQGGLLAVAVHPDYVSNGWVYLAFSDPGADGTAMTAVVRGRIRDGAWVDEQEIYRAPRELYRKGGNHFGTRLVFDRGYLYFAIGDRGAQDNAQELSRPNGKMHRVHDDGRVPADNPFVKTPGALPTIWSFGHRNPQGIALRAAGADGGDPELWETEHGPRGGDELNLIRKAANYGWPVVTFGMNYNGTPVSAETSRAGMEAPVVQWTPVIAVSGITFYEGTRYPEWRGNLFVASLAQQEVRRLALKGAEVVSQEVLFRGLGRIRDVTVGPDGLIYACLEGPGRVVRLVPEEQGAARL
jgi:glucose/arabinose dehydrogenase